MQWQQDFRGAAAAAAAAAAAGLPLSRRAVSPGGGSMASPSSSSGSSDTCMDHQGPRCPCASSSSDWGTDDALSLVAFEMQRPAPDPRAGAPPPRSIRALLRAAAPGGPGAARLTRLLCLAARRVFAEHADAVLACLGVDPSGAGADGDGGDVFGTFLARVFAMYINTNLYHNGVHALDVLLAASSLVRGGVGRRLSAFDVVAVLLAALAHDVGHFGVSGAPAALGPPGPGRAGSSSALERFHFETFRRVVQHPESDVLRLLPAKARAEMLDAVERLILATDVTRHHHHLDRFLGAEAVARAGRAPGAAGGEHLRALVLKFADVSNTCRGVGVADEWGRSILLERRMEAELASGGRGPGRARPPAAADALLGVGEPGDEALVARNQYGFVRAVVRPMFDALAPLMHAELREDIRGNLEHNMSSWRRAIDAGRPGEERCL